MQPSLKFVLTTTTAILESLIAVLQKLPVEPKQQLVLNVIVDTAKTVDDVIKLIESEEQNS